MMITRFYDAGLRPPRGSWSVTIDGQKFGNGLSESDTFQARKKFLKNNGRFVSDIDVQREMWTIYCAREPQRCNSPEPTLARKAVNLAGAVARTVKAAVTGGQVLTAKARLAARKAVCDTCEFFRAGKCKKCGCLIAAKAALAQEKCPLGKWPV